MGLLTVSLSPWEELGGLVANNTGFVDPEVWAARACECGIYSSSPSRCRGKFCLKQPEVLLAGPASCVSTYCGALHWMGGLWEVVSHQHTMPPLGNVNTHSSPGQANCDWPERPCKERDLGVPFIYSGQWKINMPVKSIFKNKGRSLNICWMQIN